MTWLTRTLSFLRAAFFRGRMERDMDAEMRAHIDARAADLHSHGVDPAAAMTQARREFGEPSTWKEHGREARNLLVLDDFTSDVRYGIRGLRRSPGFLIAAVLSLALGIGANTAIFTLMNALLLRSLPVRAPEELRVLTLSDPAGTPGYRLPYEFYASAKSETAQSAEIIASSPISIVVEIDGSSRPPVTGQLVSVDYYQVLGVGPAIGRVIQADDDRNRNGQPVAVISYPFWQSAFAGSRDVVGKVARLNGLPVTIVGVSAPEFFGTHVGDRADVSVPLWLQPQIMTDVSELWIEGPGARQPFLELIARPKPGVPAGRVDATLATMFHTYWEEVKANGGPKAKTQGDLRLSLEPGSAGLSALRRQFSRPLWVLMAVVALVLLVACANVANLLLARASSRHAEIALRVSLGARPNRLVRQMLTESIVLASLGATVGLAFAWGGARMLGGLISDRPDLLGLTPDLTVLGLTAVIALSTGLLFGIAPALRTLRVHPEEVLKTGSRTIGGGSKFALGRLLVIVQIAVSLALLVGAGLFVRTLINLRTIDLGFQEEQVITARLEPRGSNNKRSNLDGFDRMYRETLDRVRRIPGVKLASLVGATPFTEENMMRSDFIGGGYVPSPGEDVRGTMAQVYPGFFPAMGIPLLSGRDFVDDDDAPDRPGVAVVNEMFAKKYFGSPAGAIGRRAVRTSGGGPGQEIIGVVGNVHDRALRQDVIPMVYSTYRYTSTGRGQMTLVVRASGDVDAIISAVRAEAQRLDPSVPVGPVMSLAARIDGMVVQERMVAWLAAIFGGLALVLACVGTYGLMAYSVSQRYREFGVRLALGAQPSRVRSRVLAEGGLLVVIGAVIGLVASVWGVQYLRQMLYDISELDVVSFAGASALLFVTALVALYVPAWRASRVDPLKALREP